MAGDDPSVADLCADEALGRAGGQAGVRRVAGATGTRSWPWSAAARAAGASVTARGAGTGLSGAATPDDGAVLVSFARMDRILEIDPVDAVAVVQPGRGPRRCSTPRPASTG